MISLKEAREIQIKNMGNSLIKYIDQNIIRQANYGKNNPWFEASVSINISEHMAKYICDTYVNDGNWEKMVVTIKTNEDGEVSSNFYLCDDETLKYLDEYMSKLDKTERVVYEAKRFTGDNVGESEEDIVNNIIFNK